jgi:cerevisin
MPSLLRLLSLTLIAAQASGAVLSQSQQPCPHYESSGELIDEYIVELHPHHTLEDHFQNIGMDLSKKQGTDLFYPLETIHSYRARLTEDFVHNIIRFDPGVHSVERGASIQHDTSNLTTHQEPHNKLFEEISTLNERKPQWTKALRKAYYPLQQLSAGKKIVTTKDDFHAVDMLHGAGEGVDIYVLDSGIRLTHRNFGGRASHFRRKTYTEYTITDTPMDDPDGHGTHAAGIAGGLISGVAQWANLINVKVGCKYPTDCKGSAPGVSHAINDIIIDHENKKKNPPPQR